MEPDQSNLQEQTRILQMRNRELEERLRQAEAIIQIGQPTDLNSDARVEYERLYAGITSPRIRRIENEVHEINRRLRLGYHDSLAWMTADDEVTYLKELCRIIVEDCGYSLVWVGFIEDDEHKTVKPVAYAGFDESYMENLHITWADNDRGRGPSGTAIRTGKITPCHNMTTDPTFSPWREEALKRGYASSVAIPLMTDGKAFGVITVYSQDGDPFVPEEVELLARLADDAALGIQMIRLRGWHNKMEEELRASEARYHSLFDQMTEGFAIHEIILDENGVPCDYRFLDINPAFERLTGLSREQVIGKRMMEVLPNEDPVWVKAYGEVALTGKPVHFEHSSPILHRFYDVYSFSPAPNQFAVLFMDITARRQIEEDLYLSEEKYRTLYETMTQGVVYQDANGHIISSNPAAERILGLSQAQIHGRTSRDPIWRSIHEDGSEFPGEEHPIPTAQRTGKMVLGVVVGVYNPELDDYRWLKVDAIPQFRPGEDTPYRVYALFDDITPRKQMEQTIQRTLDALIRLNDLIRKLSATRNMDLILKIALEAVEELWLGMESCRIWLWDEQNPGWLNCRAAIGAERNMPAINLGVSRDDFSIWPIDDPAFVRLFNPPESEVEGAEQPPMSRPTSVITLRSADKTRGFAEFRAKPGHEITEHDKIILENLASFVAIAIENVFIYEQVSEVAVLAERSRLARDLHDSVSQALFSASLIAEALPRLWDQRPELVKPGLNQLLQLAHGALAEMRGLLVELRPATLQEMDLCDLAKMLVKASLGRAEIEIDLQVTEICTPPPDVKISIYRIAQEAMNNIIKHSDAKHVKFSICQKGPGIELFIQDDGCGFDPNSITLGHLGLEIMRERAEKSGLQLTIHSKINEGTAILLFWPGISPMGEGGK